MPKENSNSESKKQAYYIDSNGVPHNLGIRDLMYLPDLKLESVAPKIEESVDRYGNMSWHSTFTVKVATLDQLRVIGIDMAQGDSKSIETSKNKNTEVMDF